MSEFADARDRSDASDRRPPQAASDPLGPRVAPVKGCADARDRSDRRPPQAALDPLGPRVAPVKGCADARDRSDARDARPPQAASDPLDPHVAPVKGCAGARDRGDTSDRRPPQAALDPLDPRVAPGKGCADARDRSDASDQRPPQAALDPLDPRVAPGKTRIIGVYGGYRKTFSFGYVCLVYHATTLFCRRNYDYKRDPLGKTSGQMIGAARSARQNIVEGSSRAGTSKETELRLYDVARGSLEELAGDYEAFLIDLGQAPWSETEPCYRELASLGLDPFTAEGDLRHCHGEYVLAMRRRFARWLESEDPVVAANSMLVIINRAASLLHRQMTAVGESFMAEGGFTERLSQARLAARDAKIAAEGAPKCPACGGPMRKQVARKGRNAGNPFWSCCDYPNCQGTRPWSER
ncbi:MAG: four helix bundle suffix domain-containing protein [Kiritimatiellia bacterium]